MIIIKTHSEYLVRGITEKEYMTCWRNRHYLLQVLINEGGHGPRILRVPTITGSAAVEEIEQTSFLAGAAGTAFARSADRAQQEWGMELLTKAFERALRTPCGIIAFAKALYSVEMTEAVEAEEAGAAASAEEEVREAAALQQTATGVGETGGAEPIEVYSENEKFCFNQLNELIRVLNRMGVRVSFWLVPKEDIESHTVQKMVDGLADWWSKWRILQNNGQDGWESGLKGA